MSIWLRLTIFSSGPLLVWGLLYLASRFGGISLTRFIPWLRIGGIVLLGLSAMLLVFDVRWRGVVDIQGGALLAAAGWLKQRYKVDEPVMISLHI